MPPSSIDILLENHGWVFEESPSPDKSDVLSVDIIVWLIVTPEEYYEDGKFSVCHFAQDQPFYIYVIPCNRVQWYLYGSTISISQAYLTPSRLYFAAANEIAWFDTWRTHRVHTPGLSR
jgi:hypothetical protein